ncbi:AAA family ATPase [Intrasporangium calvum]|uniref:AAA family ATPase n=1 Tax=Intrasporangium calvum TaxID=53358 RepID=A0ABT5GEH0_9MICO|nr:helix-turn-helix transcriptional regulator [Intrasporangium calvum]MDC5696205.1 AAA family ATPase [Intrasporangium calvum]
MPFSSGVMVGRESDLARLAEAVGLVDSLDGTRGGVAIVSGDAGIGKSRLLLQLTTDAGQAGWLTVTGHCVGQAGSALAYLPFVELIGLLDTLTPDVVTQVLGSHPSLARLLPRRDGGTGVITGGGTDSAKEASPGLVAESVHALLTALGARRPTLVVIEDVHWADHSSRDLLTLLLTRSFTTPVALVASYRSDDLHRKHPLHETLAVWDRIPHVTHVSLAPLTDAAVGEIVGGIEGVPEDAQTMREITRRAEGNPFFAEELAASAVAGHQVNGGLGRVLRARVERLDEIAQSVVRAVSLKGDRFIGHELLARIMDLPEPELDAAIAQAVEHHVLETSWPPAYTFRHALLGETAAEALLPGERLRLHKRYAAVLAECPHLAPASELARHAAASGDLRAAVAASRAAAEAAMDVGGPQEALLHLELALSWLAEDAAERDDVTIRASEAATAAGDILRAVRLLRDAIDHPGPGQRDDVRAELLARYATLSRMLDLPVQGLDLTTTAVDLLPAEETPRRVLVLIAHIQQLVDAGALDAAVRTGDEVMAMAERLGLRESLLEIRTILTRVIEAQQDLDAVEAYLQSLLAAVKGTDRLIQLRLTHQLAAVAHRRGDLAGALAHYDEGTRIARRLHQEWAPWGLDCRLLSGLTAYELGDWDGVRSRLSVASKVTPQPARALFEAAGLAVSAGRGEAAPPGRLSALREWWYVDGMAVVLTVMPGIDLLGEAGDLTGLLEIACEAAQTLDKAWGKYHASVRLAALVAGQAASLAPRAQPELRERSVRTVEDLQRRADQLVAKVIRKYQGDDWEPTDVEVLRDSSTETWAWAKRLRAERSRLAWTLGQGELPDVEEMVIAWRESVEAFERLGHVYEAARSRARLAAALHAAGREVESRQVADSAREVAERLRARPLLAELEALARPMPAAAVAAELTPRELEVLALVSRGLSNGQIGKQLYISTKTVSVHVSNLLAKLGASGRTEAAAIARDRALVP